jgi:hypothetical protein
MSITHQDFRRSLGPLKRHYRITLADHGQRIFIKSERLDVTLVLGDEDIINLGALSMPRTTVEFIYHNTSYAERSLFISRFELSFRRGGG